MQKEKIVYARKKGGDEGKTRQEKISREEMSCKQRRGDRELVANYKAQGFISLHWVFLSHSAELPLNSC